MKRELLIGVSTIPGQFIISGLLKKIIQKIPGVELKLEISDIRKTFDKVVNGQYETINQLSLWLLQKAYLVSQSHLKASLESRIIPDY